MHNVTIPDSSRWQEPGNYAGGVITADKRPARGHRVARGNLGKQLRNLALAKTIEQRLLYRSYESNRARSLLYHSQESSKANGIIISI